MKVRKNCADCGRVLIALRTKKRCKRCAKKRTDNIILLNRRAKGILPIVREVTCIDCGYKFDAKYGTKRCDPCNEVAAKNNARRGYKKKKARIKAEWERTHNAPLGMRNLTCPHCGKEFTGHFNSKFCCIRCKQKSYCTGPRPNEEKVCPNCSTTFDAHFNAKYCSRKCELDWNRDKHNKKLRAFSKTEKGRVKNVRQAQRYRALKADAYLPSSCEDEMDQFRLLSHRATELSGVKHHVDHIIPLSIGGAHHQDNLRVVTVHENCTKEATYDPSLGGVWADNELAKEYKQIFKLHGVAYETKTKRKK